MFEIFFSERNINYVRINLAKSIYFDSIFTMIEKAVTGSVNKIDREEIIETCYAKLQQNAGGKYTYIVLDNLERISDKNQIKNEIVTLIQLLEDAELSKYKVRYLLVGIPSSLKEFFQEIEYFQPIATRIAEISKLNGFSNKELYMFINQTYIEKLHFNLNKTQLEEIQKYTMLITSGMPLRVQQYLLLLAELIIESQKVYSKHLLVKSAEKLLKAHYSEIEILAEQFFIPPTNKFSRPNQLMFLLGKLGNDNIFTVDSLLALFNQFFPLTTKHKDLRISRYLTPLTSSDTPLVAKIDKTKFRLIDSNVKIWINSKLYIEVDTEIVRQNV